MRLWRVIDTDTRKCIEFFTKEMPARQMAHDLNVKAYHKEHPGERNKYYSSDYPRRFMSWQDPDLPGLN